MLMRVGQVVSLDSLDTNLEAAQRLNHSQGSKTAEVKTAYSLAYWARCISQGELTDTGLLSLVDLPSPDTETLWETQDRT